MVKFVVIRKASSLEFYEITVLVKKLSEWNYLLAKEIKRE